MFASLLASTRMLPVAVIVALLSDAEVVSVMKVVVTEPATAMPFFFFAPAPPAAIVIARPLRWACTLRTLAASVALAMYAFVVPVKPVCVQAPAMAAPLSVVVSAAAPVAATMIVSFIA